MDLTKLAQGLIEGVGGIVCDRHVEGTVLVLESLINAIHNQWHEHLMQETEHELLYSDILCECGRLLEMKRYKDCTTIKNM